MELTYADMIYYFQDERMVADLLSGRRDDITLGLRDRFMYERTYLRDMYSLAEVIIPVRQESRVLGAIVRLVGY